MARLGHWLLGSVRRQLILGVALVHAVMMSLFIWDLTERQQAMLMDQQASHAQALAQSAATSSAGWLLARDVTGLQEIIDAQHRYPELRYAMALDQQGAVLAHTDRKYRGKYLTDLPASPELAVLRQGEDLVDVVSPALVAGQHVGWIRIGVGQQAASLQLARITHDGLFYALVAILLGGLLAGVMGTRLTRRLSAMQAVADGVASGRAELRAPAHGEDEMAHLARRFNEMLDTLARRNRETLASREALHHSQERLSRVMAITGEGIWDWDLRLDRVTHNARWGDMLGLDPAHLEHPMTEFSDLLHEQDRDAVMGRIRRCLEGTGLYHSEHRMRRKDGQVIWVQDRGNVVERGPDGQPLRMLGSITEITERKEAEVMLHQDQEQQAVLRAMLEDVLRGGGLEETLDACLTRLLAVSWLSLLTKGGIFLMDADEEALRLAVSRDLSPEILSLCNRVPTGRCHCGRAAATKELQFSQRLDHRHEISYPGMAEHGHYNLPLLSEGEVLGVMVLYLPHGFERDPAKEQFLTTVADVLAGFIRRKRTERALERSEQRYRILMDTAPDAIYINQEGIFTYLNPAALRLFGARDAGVLLGTRVLDRIHAKDHDLVRERMRILTEERRAVPALEEKFIRMDGTTVDVEVTAAPYSDDVETGMQVIVRDITERKRAEEALQRLNEELEERVEQRTIELVAARYEAERSSRAKSEFLSRMSHELRTPLNAILGFGQLLELELRNPEQADNVKEILHAGQHLLELINEVLDLARIESGKFTVSKEPVPLMPLIGDCLTLIRPQAEARGIRIVEAGRDCGEHVRADRVRLKQVLLNLLSNAVKYNRDGGEIGIACVDQGEAILVRISDTGAGLTPEQQGRLFVAFERLDADQHAVEGSGIGLALSKRLVELMDGEIGVESTAGLGSTFWVRLPTSDGHPEPAHPTTGTATLEPPRSVNLQLWDVLCIEDNPANLRLIERILARRPDVRLLTASAPGLGLELAAAHRPALILLDINLPDMDGYDVMNCLREHPATRDIPVVAISANAMPKDLARGKAAGFADYLTKPLDVDRLLRVVDDVIGKAVPILAGISNQSDLSGGTIR